MNVAHGSPDDDSERHYGDLGNIESIDGVAIFEQQNSLVKLNGEYSVIGRSLVIHKNADDLGKGDFNDSKITGHSGAKIACA